MDSAHPSGTCIKFYTSFFNKIELFNSVVKENKRVIPASKAIVLQTTFKDDDALNHTYATMGMQDNLPGFNLMVGESLLKCIMSYAGVQSILFKN